MKPEKWIFRDESDIRRWVFHHFGRKARRIEPSTGSTFGIPDTFLVIPVNGVGVTAWLELKLGRYVGTDLRFTVRAPQRKTIRSLATDRVPVNFLIGVGGSDHLYLVSPTRDALGGSVDISKSGTFSKRFHFLKVGPFNPDALTKELERLITK